MGARQHAGLELRQLSERLAALKLTLPLRSPPDGWIRTIRKALGIRTGQLAVRLGVTQPSVVHAEAREVAGTISLETLRRFASELDCELVYFLIPRGTLLQTVERRAEEVARAEAMAVAASLGLEWQVVPSLAVADQIDRQKEKLVAERPARLWDSQNANDGK
jgi:predicted DNA-binding mobile mystery protein A